MKKNLSVKKMALIGMLGALAGLLMMLKTPLPFMPPFMDFDLAAVPEMIGGFALGPFAAVCIIAVKLLVKLSILGTSSMFVGELSNFLLSCAYVLPAIWVYNRNRDKKSAVKGMALGVFTAVVMAVMTNLLLIIPFYASVMGFGMDAIVDMCHKAFPLVKDEWTLALFGIVPFNIIKFGSASLVTYVVYKKLSIPLKKFAE